MIQDVVKGWVVIFREMNILEFFNNNYIVIPSEFSVFYGINYHFGSSQDIFILIAVRLKDLGYCKLYDLQSDEYLAILINTMITDLERINVEGGF